MKMAIEEAMVQLEDKGFSKHAHRKSLQEAVVSHRIAHFPVVLLALRQLCGDHQKLCECFPCTALRNAEVVEVPD